MNDAGVARLAGLLTRRLVEAGQPPDAELSVAELHRRLLPYPVCRQELGLVTKAQYDLLMLGLLGASDYLEIEEQALLGAVRRERRSPEPGLDFLRNFAASRLRVAAERARATVRGPKVATEHPARNRGAEPSGAEPQPVSGTSTEPQPGGEAPGPGTAAEPAGAPGVVAARCWQCARALPARQGVRFCPFCGTDQTFRPCGECGADLELEWSFCPLCGRAVQGPDGR